MAEGALRVDRWTAHYLVPAGHSDPERLRERLDQVLRLDLPDALARGLAPLLCADDARVCFLRRLEFPLTLNAARPREQIGLAWSAALARALAESTGEDVVVFRDRAEYLGCFLVDQAGNRAWRRWYYGPFAGLRPLPASAAIRTALGDEPTHGLSALLRLPAADLTDVLAALTERDAARALDHLAAELGGDPVTAFRAAVPAWRAARHQFGHRGGERAALVTFVLACRDHAGHAGQALALAARALTALEALGAAAPDRLYRLLTTIGAADPAPGDASLLVLRACPPDLHTQVVAELTGRPLSAADPTPDGPSTAAWGGMFHLLPHLGELGLDHVAAGWPGLPGTDAPALLRLLVLAACGGPDHRAAILADPLARRLTGVDPWPTAAEVRAWANARPASAGDALIAELDERGRAHHRTSAAIREALVHVRRHGAPVAVLVDLDDGVWRFAGHPRPGHHAPEREAPAEGTDRLDQVTADLDYLLPAGSAAPLDWAVAVAAQHTLRAFSRRLPGFARSSLSYLARNFLDAPAALTEDDDRRLVRIGRPPLGLVLALTGANRGAYRLSWLDDRPFLLFPEGDG
jgi:hypothetical protein